MFYQNAQNSKLAIMDALGLEVARGKVIGVLPVEKFGINGDADTGAEEDIWEIGGDYTFSTTADIDSISSSNAGDTGNVIVEGLDENWDFVQQTVVLTGQTTATLTTPLIRFFRAWNDSATDLQGTVYIYINGATVSAGVPTVQTEIRGSLNSDNQTLMTIYSVPAGHTLFIISYYGDMLKQVASAGGEYDLRTREFGKVFRTRHHRGLINTGTSALPHRFEFPIKVNEKGDVKMTISTTANDVRVSAGFAGYLIDNNLED